MSEELNRKEEQTAGTMASESEAVQESEVSLETEETVQETEVSSQAQEAEEKSAPPVQSRRTNILWAFAGLYLIYNGYSLCKSVIGGAEGASPWFMVAGIAFIGIGGFLTISGGLNLSREEKIKRQQAEEGQEPSQAPAGGLFKGLMPAAAEPEEKKKMSIAERARLTENIDAPEGEEPEERKEESNGGL